MPYVQPIDKKLFRAALLKAYAENALSFVFEGEEFSIGYGWYILNQSSD